VNYAGIAAILLAFGLIVLFHEAGHFIAARLSGMAIHEFSIGIGRPLLFWFRRGETQYSFRLWPFFSFVRVAGMEPGDEHPRGFHTKSRLAQAFVLAMGCLSNFLLAIGIYVVIGSVIGVVEPRNTVESVVSAEPPTPAAQAGLLPGDKLLGVVEGTELSVEDLRREIQNHPETPMTLVVEREGERRTIDITPMAVTGYDLQGLRLVEVPLGQIGILFESERKRIGVVRSIRMGFLQTIGMIQLQAAGVLATVSRTIKPDVMGPVGVVDTMYRDTKESWPQFLATFAAIAIAIGFLNLLPIPPLDGSRLVIVGLEAIRRKPFDKQKESIVHIVGFALFLALVVVITYKDILRIIAGGS
jgi:regulator of sigma E protease